MTSTKWKVVTAKAKMRTHTVFVGFKFAHHGQHAGYDMIRHYAGYDMCIDCQRSYEWLRRVRSRSRKWLWGRLFRRVFSRPWWIELYCLYFALVHRNIVFHFVFAENTYRYLGWFKWLGFRIVCTYHQPFAFFDEHPKYLRGVRAVDDIIVLSAVEQAYFQKWKGDSRVHFIPHGIDTAFFCPNRMVMRRREVLIVGNWLRDFEFAAGVCERLLSRDAKVEIHVVAMKENLAKFKPHERLHLHNAVSDEDLLLRYQQAKLVFLPLYRLVANNAVLEASACNCPILVATNQAERSGVLPWVEYVEAREEVVLRKIAFRLDSEDDTGCRVHELVEHSFGWQEIGSKTRAIWEHRSV